MVQKKNKSSEELKNLGLKVSYIGKGKVMEQSIIAGEKLIKGSTIILN